LTRALPVALLALACQKAGPPRSSAPAATPAPAALPAPAGAAAAPGAPPVGLVPPPAGAAAALAGAEAALVLHSPGAMPRATLGALPAPARTWGGVLRSTSSAQTTLGGLDGPVLPGPVLTVHAAVDGPPAGGPGGLRQLVVQAVTVGGPDGAPLPGPTAALAPLVGLPIGLAPAVGGGLRVDLPPPAGPAAELLTALLAPSGLLGVPLPAAPVGDGARWSHWSRVHQGGLPVVQEVAVALHTEPSGARTLHVALHRWLDHPGPLPLPDPTGATLVGFSSEGHGRLLLVGDEAVPIAVFDEETAMSLSVDDPALGAPVAVDVRLRAQVEVRPAPPR
jgi:hypothetical protein